MASNSFGNVFRFTTWGESHGPAIGVVIDGCPAGIALDEETINRELARRAPGSSPYTSQRSEKDVAHIQSGVFEGKTTGTSLSIVIPNKDADSSKYAPIADLLRPGHANYTYLVKYGRFDYRGGGRASARETACRVAAGAVARCLLKEAGVTVGAWLASVGNYQAPEVPVAEALAHAAVSRVFAPSAAAEEGIIREVDAARKEGDSVGGVVNFVAQNVPAGLGDPIYQKLDALLAFAMLSIPASKGFELGTGFDSPTQRGSRANDRFIAAQGNEVCATNHAGGTLGGISTGMPIQGRVAFKPTPSIFISQDTVDIHGNAAQFNLPKGSRHDPCVAIRAVPVVEAMCLATLADALLMNRVAHV